MAEKHLMETFLADKKVQDFLQLSNDVNIFSILEIDENRHSNLMAWLLAPRGSHKHGDVYLKALLYSVVGEMNSESHYSDFIKDWSYTALDWLQLGNAVVLREVTLDEKNRIDLVISDCASGICFFIETKIGAPYNVAQLDNYNNLIKKKFTEAKYPVFVFLHPDSHHANKAQSPWLGLTYNWLTRAIEKRIHRDTPDVNQTDYLLDQLVDWHADRFSFCNMVGYEDAALHITTQHDQFLKYISNTTHKADEYLSLLTQGDDTELLYARHSDKFEYLMSFSVWQKLGEDIKASITNYEVEFDCSHSYLLIHNKAWCEFYDDKDKTNFYLWIELYISKDSASINNDDMLHIAVGHTSSMIKESNLIKIKSILIDESETILFYKNTLSLPRGSSITDYFNDIIPVITNIFYRIDSISK